MALRKGSLLTTGETPRLARLLAELAARLQSLGVDIDRTAISKIEGGRRLITDVEIIAVCQALGIGVASLFAEFAGPTRT